MKLLKIEKIGLNYLDEKLKTKFLEWNKNLKAILNSNAKEYKFHKLKKVIKKN